MKAGFQTTTGKDRVVVCQLSLTDFLLQHLSARVDDYHKELMLPEQAPDLVTIVVEALANGHDQDLAG